MSKELDEYTLEELLAAVKRKRKAGERLRPGRKEDPQPCMYCGVRYSWRERQKHEPRCDKNPHRAVAGTGDNLRPMGGRIRKGNRLLKQAREVLQKYYLEVAYDGVTKEWWITEKEGPGSWLVDESEGFHLIPK